MTVFNAIGTIRASATGGRLYTGDFYENTYDKQGDSHQWYMYGGWGNDTLISGQGDDLLEGQQGNDTLSGHSGHDTLFGGSGSDQLYGGDDADNLIGGAGNDTMTGGSGHDNFLFYNEDNVDRALFHTGDDIITDFNPDNDEIFLDGDCLASRLDVEQDGLDAIITHSAGTIRVKNTTVAELEGRIKDGDGAVLIWDDLVIHRPPAGDGYGSYSLTGGFGDDIFVASTANNTDHLYLDGGLGYDIVSFANLNYTFGTLIVDLAAASVTWTMQTNEQHQKNDSHGATYNSIEGVIGSAYNDTIRGDSKHNGLVGNAGNDTIHGHGGNDTIAGGANDDKLYGGSGNDDVTAGSGADRIWGEDGNDTLRGDQHNDIVNGGNGSDIVNGGSGNDTLTGGAGVDHFVTGNGFDVITDFQFGIDQLSFEATATTLRPMGMDTVIGFADGSETTLRNMDLYSVGSLFDGMNIIGGAGADLLTGTAGSDTMTGGGGGDCFWASTGNDVITDFTAGSDRIDFSGFAGLTAADVAMRYYQVTDSLKLSWQDHSLTLEGVSELAAGDNSLGLAFAGWQPELNVATAAGVSGYGGQDKASAVTEVLEGGAVLKLSGNGWKQALLDDDYRLSSDSSLHFDFKGSGLSEVWGIGIDNNGSLQTNTDPMGTSGVVWLGGSQAPDSNVRHDGIFYSGNGAWQQHMEIQLGQELAGESIDRFVFVNDNDANANAGTAEFADVWLSDVDRVNGLDFAAAAPSLAGYANQNENSGFAVSTDGSEAHITGNSWISVDLGQDYAITADTLLRFEFKGEGTSEAWRLGVDNDGLMNSQGNAMPAENLFSLGGTDDVGLASNGNVIRDPANFYDQGAGGWQSFVIALGDLLAGETVDRFVMVNDNDANSYAGGYFLRGVELVEPDMNVGLLFA